MYAVLWRALPGGRLAKVVQCAMIVGLVVAVLFLWVFPAVAARLPHEQVTIASTGCAKAGEPAELAAARAAVPAARQGERPA